MKKLLLIILIFSIFGCSKEAPRCGVIVAIPPPYVFTDTAWYSVAIINDEGYTDWLRVDSAYYLTLTEGMYICK
jgi:hypothetical protein